MSADVNATLPPAQSQAYAFFPQELWVAFCESCLVHARMAGLDVRYGPAGQLDSTDGASFGLLTIARKVAEVPRDEWDPILEEYFASIESVVSNDEFGTDVLRVRLFPADVVPPDALKQPQWRQFAPGVLAALVAALPGALRTLNPSDFDRLEPEIDALWDIAWDNVLHLEEVERQETERGGSAELLSFFGKSFFVASKVGRLDQLVDGIGDKGALVAIPRRHSLAVHVIRDLSVVDAIKTLLPYCRNVASQGPGPITEQLFWWHDGELTVLPSEEQETQISFSPPIEFIEMLNTLAPSEPGAESGAAPAAPASSAAEPSAD